MEMRLESAGPPQRPGGGRKAKYPWREMMDTEESLLVECEQADKTRVQSCLSGAGANWLRNHRIRSHRIVTRQEQDGVRVWVMRGAKKK